MIYLVSYTAGSLFISKLVKYKIAKNLSEKLD